MNEKFFTIAEMQSECAKMGFVRSKVWFRQMVNYGLIKTKMEKRNVRGFKNFHVIAFSELVRILHDKPKLSVQKNAHA